MIPDHAVSDTPSPTDTDAPADVASRSDTPVGPDTPAPDPDTEGGQPGSSRRTPRVHAVTALLATFGVVVACFGLYRGLQPVATPSQDCGTAFGFLMRGELNEYVDPAAPPKGVTAAEAEANNAEPCQERAAQRAKPAAGVAVAGILFAFVASLTDLGVRARRWWRVRPPRA